VGRCDQAVEVLDRLGEAWQAAGEANGRPVGHDLCAAQIGVRRLGGLLGFGGVADEQRAVHLVEVGADRLGRQLHAVNRLEQPDHKPHEEPKEVNRHKQRGCEEAARASPIGDRAGPPCRLDGDRRRSDPAGRRAVVDGGTASGAALGG
jgi:hypothetical protein